ncbi:gamma carbonic anhydrase family protein [Gilvimarinus sp. F26214L]|uniref:gamma carbonic anhydrase family protein n=1 Tax=Gilvimarinus sp. DZF01 TaxID=3461371 RepID=UPI004045D8FA
MQNIRPFRDFHPQLGERVYVDPLAAVIGDVELGQDSSVWPAAVLRGDVNHIRIGERTSIQDGSIGHVTHKSESLPEGWPLIIGDDVTVGHKVVLHGCTVGNRVLVGMGAIVLDGAVIEDDVMIGAGTLVPPGKVLERGYLYLGSPCKQVRRLSEPELQRLPYSARHYVRLKNDYLA